MTKKYTADVSEKEIRCIVVVAKLLLRLLIEYYTDKKRVVVVNSLIKSLKLLTKRNKI